MEIRTTKQIKDSRCFAQSYNAKIHHDNVKWVKLDDILKEVKLIHTWHKTHRTLCLIKVLEDAITSDSEPDGSTHNKDLTENQK